MGSVELLQDLIHDGVGQVGDHRQLHLPANRRAPPSVCLGAEPGTPTRCPPAGRVLLQRSVDVLRCSLHQGVADGGARDGHLLGDGGKGWAEALGGRAGHGAQLAAQGHHGVHHHLTVKAQQVLSQVFNFRRPLAVS